MKLTAEGITIQAKRLVENSKAMYAAQVAIYTMVGGSILGKFAVEQPEDFYIDDRVGKRPYAKRDILQAVAVLAEAYRLADRRPDTELELVNLGVF